MTLEVLLPETLASRIETLFENGFLSFYLPGTTVRGVACFKKNCDLTFANLLCKVRSFSKNKRPSNNWN